MITSVNMGLTIWDQESDGYSHTQLAANLSTIDAHDHSNGKGVQISTAGIAINAITTALLADGSVTGTKIANGAISSVHIGAGQVVSSSIATGAIHPTHFGSDVVFAPSGLISAYGGTGTAPSGWIYCDGSSYPIGSVGSTYYNLAQALGAAYNQPTDAAGTFRVPDLQSRVPVGLGVNSDANAMGKNDGVAAGSRTLSHKHTAEPHTHTMADHTHTVPDHTHTITSDGQHEHPFDWGNGLSGSLYQQGINATAGSNFQAAYVPYLNSGGSGSLLLNMLVEGGHNHGGQTGSSSGLITGVQSNNAVSSTSVVVDSAQGLPYVIVNYIIKL